MRTLIEIIEFITAYNAAENPLELDIDIDIRCVRISIWNRNTSENQARFEDSSEKKEFLYEIFEEIKRVCSDVEYLKSKQIRVVKEVIETPYRLLFEDKEAEDE